MSLEGIRAHPDEVAVTVGSQQALDLITKIFVDSGDVVLAEGPSYVGELGTFASYEAQVVHVPVDDHGLIPEALEEAVTRLAAEVRRIKFLYTVPSFHNPAGVTLDAGRRVRVLSICQQEGFPLIEDNPYGLLGFEASRSGPSALTPRMWCTWARSPRPSRQACAGRGPGSALRRNSPVP